MTRSSDLDGALRSLDAADARPDPGGPRALADLQTILSFDPPPGPQRPSTGTAARSGRSRLRSGRPARRLALAGATLIAATAAVLVLPPASGGDTAFASWTPAPDAVPTSERSEAADECRRAHQDGDDAARLRSAEPVIAERRGVWTTVVLAGPDGSSAMCVTDESRPFYDQGMIGHSSPAAVGSVAPGPRELIAHALGSGIVDDEPLSLAAGTAGSDVVAIAYLSPTHGAVTASVSQGHFALWLPGTELEGASSAGVELRVTYRDGSTSSSRLSF